MAPNSKMGADETEKVHELQASIYSKSRGVTKVRTGKMFAYALRDFQRQQHAPMKHATPAQRRRRYTIDVNTGVEERKVQRVSSLSYWNLEWPQLPFVQNFMFPKLTQDAQARDLKIMELERMGRKARKPKSNKTLFKQSPEPVVASTPLFSFPKPRRYHEFNKFWNYVPPTINTPYLRIDDALITYKQFLDITCTTGYDSFMEDNGLDTALAVLSLDKHCAASKIRVASTVEAQVCLYPDQDGKEEYAKVFADKDWIFIPVNDAMGQHQNAGLLGIHWSLVALDRTHKRMHYIDSMFMGSEAWWQAACKVAMGMLALVGENAQQWSFLAEWNSPDQKRDNRFRDEDGDCADAGACGPFVWTMVSVLVDKIQKAQLAGTENECFLDLDDSTPAWFGGWWHSAKMRKMMQNCIGDKKKWQDVEGWAEEHDEEATRGREMSLDELSVTSIESQSTQTSEPDEISKLSDVSMVLEEESTAGTEEATVQHLVHEATDFAESNTKKGEEVIEIL